MKLLKRPLLLLVALAIGTAMLGLGRWQLDRAEQKQLLLDQVVSRSLMPTADISGLLPSFETNSNGLRYRSVSVSGRYLADKSLFLDNKVHDTRVGYKLITPFLINGHDRAVLVDRGWLPAGASRERLPVFETPDTQLQLFGRLNLPMGKPALWKDSYPVNNGPVWQYLPIDNYAQQMQLNVLPLVVELAPDQPSEIDQSLIRRWDEIDDQWVAKHKGYAFQWFAMAAAFFVACLILVFRAPQSD